jgi:hypothetical protein
MVTENDTQTSITDCGRCHKPEDWSAPGFDHSKTAFKLDGAHQNVQCRACHLPVEDEEGLFIRYKSTDTACAACHGGKYQDDSRG